MAKFGIGWYRNSTIGEMKKPVFETMEAACLAANKRNLYVVEKRLKGDLDPVCVWFAFEFQAKGE